MTNERLSIQTLAQRVTKLLDGEINKMFEGEGAADAMLEEIDRTYGRETVLAVIEEVQRQAEFEHEEKVAKYERDKRFAEEAIQILKGLPEGTKLLEACKIKAAQGDPLAQRYLAFLNSRTYRTETALHKAAAAVHRGWQANADGSSSKIDDAAPESAELIEWLYREHPEIAPQVEAAIEAGDDPGK
jgi:hypothetical protein